jgi:hypothetical protein
MAHTYQVRDFARSRARFAKKSSADCIRYATTAETVFYAPHFLGKLDADVCVEEHAPYFATFQSGAYRGDNAAKAETRNRNDKRRSRRTAE